MKKIFEFICNNKIKVIVIYIILLILSFVGMSLTKINYDILVYLPDDIETIKGQNILTNDFDIGAYSIALVENMPSKEILKLENEIKQIDGVTNAISIYDVIGNTIPVEMLPNDISSKLNKDNTDILLITFKNSTSHIKTITAVDEIRTLCKGKVKQGGMSSLVLDTMKLSQEEIVVYIIIAVVLCIIILQISFDSYIVPFILLSNIGVAILLNMGTNIFLGQISYITKALVAVLQLGVTTDFSIFLYHSYERNKTKFKSKEDAMVESIRETLLSVTGSSLTTIFGFLALCAMKLTLGKDLGIVMAKGILLGVITVITLFPCLLLVFNNVIVKTKHKVVIPTFNKFNSFIIKHNKVIFILFVILLIPSFQANRKVSVYYDLDSSLPKSLESITADEYIKNNFNIASPELILIDKELKNDDVINMINEIKTLDGVEWVLSFRDIKKLGITEEMLPSELSDVFESDKYEMIYINSIYDIATNELNSQIDEVRKIVKKYDKNALVAGQGPLTKDLVETYATDYNHVNVYSILCIFIVLLFLLKSFSLPLLLILVIEFAIFINLSFSYFHGTILPFIATITLGTIQLGATIDYAILVTTTYISNRKKIKNKEEAMLKTMNNTTSSILISGICFFAATFGVGVYSKIAMIGSICTLISRGALISVVVVLIVLPSVLLITDKLIFKRKEKHNMKKITKKLALILLASSIFLTPITSLLALEKEETVYGKLNYDGSQKSIVVNEQLFNRDKLDIIEDYSELKDILNIKNDASFTLNDNRLTWNAKGNDIFYKGTIDKNIPITLEATYYLNGKEYKAAEMLGKSGKVTIKLKYTNNDRHGNLYTPFVVTMGTVINSESNSNMHVNNGKVIDNGSNFIVVAIAAPGLYESLNLNELKNMDTISIEYDTTKFELSSIYSIITSKLIDTSDLKVFDKMNTLYNDMDKLKDGMNQIDKGSKELSEGIQLLYSNYGKFNEGIGSVNENFAKLNDGVQKLDKEIDKILDNKIIQDFRSYLPVLQEQITNIKEITDKYTNNVNDYLNQSDNAVDGITNDILNIIDYLKTVEEYLDNTDDYSSVVEEYTNSLNDYLDQILDYINNAINYLDNLDDMGEYTSSLTDYIIKTYESDPENASDELKALYNEAIKIKNSDNLSSTLNDITLDKEKLNNLKTNITNAKTRLNELSNSLITDQSKLKDTLDDIRKSSINLKDIEEKVKKVNENIHNTFSEVDTDTDALSKLINKIEDLSNGIDNFENGVNELSEGTNALYQGINTLSNYSNQIYDGISALKDGSDQLSAGISKFNREGICKLNDFVNNDLKNTINNTKQLIKLGNNYSSFASGNENINGSTKFILVIDSLNVKEVKKETKATKETTFWDRIINLF